MVNMCVHVCVNDMIVSLYLVGDCHITHRQQEIDMGVCVRVCVLVLFYSVRDAVIYHWQGIGRLVRVYVCVFVRKGERL